MNKIVRLAVTAGIRRSCFDRIVSLQLEAGNDER
jgi:hypothetical protein